MPLNPNAMANVIAGKKVRMSNSFTAEEMSRFVKNLGLNLVDQDKLMIFHDLGLVETPLYADAKLAKRATNSKGDEIRAISTVIVVLHKDNTYDCAEAGLSFLAGKDVYSSKEVCVRKGASGNLYYAYHELDAVNSTAFQLPLAFGSCEFSYDFCLEVKGTVDGYKELPLSESFVEDEVTGKFTNCQKILDLGEGGVAELRPTSRPCLVKAAMPTSVTIYKRAAQKFMNSLLGTK